MEIIKHTVEMFTRSEEDDKRAAPNSDAFLTRLPLPLCPNHPSHSPLSDTCTGGGGGGEFVGGRAASGGGTNLLRPDLTFLLDHDTDRELMVRHIQGGRVLDSQSD